MTMTPDDGQMLVAWCSRHDDVAFRSLCERHAGMVAAACRRLGSPDVEESAQAVFVVLARRAGSVSGPHLVGWLGATARRVVADQRRAAASRQRHEKEAAMEEARQRNKPAPEPTWDEARCHLDEALASLSANRREAVMRFYLEGKPQGEVASELGCSVDAVKTRVHEGLERLRSFFARRGVALSAVTLASGLASEAAAAEPAFAASCAKAALIPASAPGATAIASLVSPVAVGTVAMFAVLTVLLTSFVGISSWQAQAVQPAPVVPVGIPAIAPGDAAQLLFSETFEDDDFASRGWYDDAGFSTSTAEHAPGSLRSAEFRFQTGSQTPLSTGRNRRLFPPTDAIRLTSWIKVGPEWATSESYMLLFLILTTADDAWAAPSPTHLTCSIGVNRDAPFIRLQDARNLDTLQVGRDLVAVTEKRSVAGGNGDSDGYGSGSCFRMQDGSWWNEKLHLATLATPGDHPHPYLFGRWCRVEVQLRLNHIVAGKAVADGQMTCRIDGRLVLDHRRVLFRTSQHADMQFNQVLIAPWSSEPQRPQTIWIDDFSVSTDLSVSTDVDP